MPCRGCQTARKVIFGTKPRVYRPPDGWFSNGLTPAQRAMHLCFALLGMAVGLALLWAAIKGTVATTVVTTEWLMDMVAPDGRQ